MQYGWIFAGIALILTLSSAVSARLAHRISPRQQLATALGILLAAFILLTGIVFSGMPSAWAILPLAIAVGSIGFILGNAASSAIVAVPHAAGTGSAIMGALQYGLGAIVAPLVEIKGEGSAVPLCEIMFFFAVLATLSFRFATGGTTRRASPRKRAADTCFPD
jgi:DHA1 family bicyclomycin/chloramphenicol resistance-like MFS transporter